METRRSVRKYTACHVNHEVLESVLKAAFLAPSPSNAFPVAFREFQSSESRLDLMSMLKSSYDELKKESSGDRRAKRLIQSYWRFIEPMLEAPVLLAVGIREYKGLGQLLTKVIHEKRYCEDSARLSLGASLYALSLKAHSLGLGSCIYTAPMRILQKGEIDQLTGINVLGFMTLGYPAESPEVPGRPDLCEVFKKI